MIWKPTWLKFLNYLTDHNPGVVHLSCCYRSTWSFRQTRKIINCSGCVQVFVNSKLWRNLSSCLIKSQTRGVNNIITSIISLISIVINPTSSLIYTKVCVRVAPYGWRWRRPRQVCNLLLTKWNPPVYPIDITWLNYYWFALQTSVRGMRTIARLFVYCVCAYS